MSNDILIGIDLGTTVLKVCAFDARTGAVRGESARRLPVRATADGGREQSLRSVDRSFREAVADVRGQAGTAWGRVCGIGLAAQGGSSIIADRNTGKALTPMVLWNDGRTHGHLARVAAKTSAKFWRKHVLQDPPPTGLGRLLWLQETQPDLFRDDTIHIGAGEYLFFRLTGTWRQDAGNAIQIGSYNAVTKKLDAKLIGKVGLPLSFVAPLRQGHETAPLSKRGARLLGVTEGVPVAGPYIDQEGGYLSAAGVSKRPLQCSLGTAWVGNFVLPDEETGYSPRQLVLSSPTGAGRMVILCPAVGNGAWDWGLRTCLGAHDEKALAKAADIFRQGLLPPKGLVALPWHAQANFLRPGTHGGGAILGLGPHTERPDILRAVAVSMACEFTRGFRHMIDRRSIDSVVLGGGASKGKHFRDLIAALFAPIPVLWQQDSDLSAARGAVYAFSEGAATGKTRPVRTPSHALVDELARYYTYYCEVVERLCPSARNDAFVFDTEKEA